MLEYWCIGEMGRPDWCKPSRTSWCVEIFAPQGLLSHPPPKGLSAWDGPELAIVLKVKTDAVWKVLRKGGIHLQGKYRRHESCRRHQRDQYPSGHHRYLEGTLQLSRGRSLSLRVPWGEQRTSSKTSSAMNLFSLLIVSRRLFILRVLDYQEPVSSS